jgi:hypothetical protein
MELTVSLLGNGLATIAEQIPARAQQAVATAVADVRARAELNAHVLSGAMRASVYSVLPGGKSDYGSSVSTAQSLKPGVGILDERDAAGQISGLVAVAVDYAAYQEVKDGHAFLIPAADAVRPSFEAAMREVAG